MQLVVNTLDQGLVVRKEGRQEPALQSVIEGKCRMRCLILICVLLLAGTSNADETKTFAGLFRATDLQRSKYPEFAFMRVWSGEIVRGNRLPRSVIAVADIASVDIDSREIAISQVYGLEFDFTEAGRRKIGNHFQENENPLVIVIDGQAYGRMSPELGNRIANDGETLFVAFPISYPVTEHLLKLLVEKFNREAGQ